METNCLSAYLKQHEFIFKCFSGHRFSCTNFKTGLTPADFASIFGWSIPDKTQFLRIKDYELGLSFEYRDYGSHITIFLNELKQ